MSISGYCISLIVKPHRIYIASLSFIRYNIPSMFWLRSWGHEKRNIVLWVDRPSEYHQSVSQVIFFFVCLFVCLFFFLFFLVVKQTHVNRQLKSPKIWHFWRKILKKIFSAILKKFQPNLLWLWQKNGWFYMVLANLKKKKISQNGKSGSVRPVKQGFLLSWPRVQFKKKKISRQNNMKFSAIWRSWQTQNDYCFILKTVTVGTEKFLRSI